MQVYKYSNAYVFSIINVYVYNYMYMYMYIYFEENNKLL